MPEGIIMMKVQSDYTEYQTGTQATSKNLQTKCHVASCSGRQGYSKHIYDLSVLILSNVSCHRGLQCLALANQKAQLIPRIESLHHPAKNLNFLKYKPHDE